MEPGLLLQQLLLAWPLHRHNALCRLLAWQFLVISAGRPLLPAHGVAQRTCAFHELPDLAAADAGPCFALQMLQSSHKAEQQLLDHHMGFERCTLFCWAGTRSFR